MNNNLLSQIRNLRKSISDARIIDDNDIVEISQPLPQDNQSSEKKISQVSMMHFSPLAEPAIASVESPIVKKHEAIHPSIQALIDKENEDSISNHEKKRLVAEQYKSEYLLPRLKDAGSRHYKKWLRGYLALGGIPVHYYNYDWRGFIATDDIVLEPLFGSLAIKIIVPCSVNFIGSTGHCKVFLMKDFSYMGCGDFVPVYKDTIV